MFTDGHAVFKTRHPQMKMEKENKSISINIQQVCLVMNFQRFQTSSHIGNNRLQRRQVGILKFSERGSLSPTKSSFEGIKLKNNFSLKNLPNATQIISNKPQTGTMGLSFPGEWMTSLYFVCDTYYL